MKTIVDIPEEVRNDILTDGVLYTGYEPNIRDAIKNGIAIPDNATNMDVLLSLFPDLTVDVEYPLIWRYDKKKKKNDMLCDMFDRDWLNEQYDWST